MYQLKTNVTAQEILEKEFPIVTRGYSMPDVDRFLDELIADINIRDKELARFEQENKQLVNDNLMLKQEIRKLKSNLDAVKGSGNEVTNLDILRRLSHLEKIVYGEE